MNETKTILKLNDGTEYAIEPGAAIYDMTVICANREAAVAMQEKITPANLSHIEVITETTQEGEEEPERMVTGIYENMMGTFMLPSEDNTDGTVTVNLSLKEKDMTESRLESLEESVEMVTAAILLG